MATKQNKIKKKKRFLQKELNISVNICKSIINSLTSFIHFVAKNGNVSETKD